MTNHLSAQDFVSALDRELSSERQSHLDRCHSCQVQVEDLRALLQGAVQAGEVPEPSPLFWDHFHARVLSAVQVETPAARQAWWNNWAIGKTWLTVSAVVITVVASAALYLNGRVAPAPDASLDNGVLVDAGTPSDSYAVLDNDEWEFVTSVMGTLESDDIHEVLTPSRDAVDTAFEALTEREREAFVKLLKAEMGQGTVQ